MFAISRQASALTLAAVLVLGSARPVTAAEDAGGATQPAPELTIVSPSLLSATTTALSPSIFSDAVQRPPVNFAGPRQDGPDGLTAVRRSMYVSFAALQIMDAVSTRKALAQGAREANPAMGSVAKNSAALFAVKAGTAAATTFFAEKLAKKHPRRAAIIMAVLNAGYAAVVAHNYRVARSQRR